MGVSGCGKSTVAAALARELGQPFCEGDALHPPANVAKLAAGIPLTDQDRRPWLEAIGVWVDERLAADESGVVTCSALKRAYRDLLVRDRPGVFFVYLAGDRDTIRARLAGRRGHFMPASLLDSQFADLAEPTPDEPVLRVDLDAPVTVLVTRILAALSAISAGPRP